MHDRDLSRWTHDHIFSTADLRVEAATWRVVVLTITMMLVEVAAGLAFRSMALFADGCHMSTHALALGIAALAYRFARRYAGDERFTFGTWKIEILGAFASAIVLMMVALFMAAESIHRLIQPVAIRYDQALVVAVLGLLVNLLSAWLLRTHHPHPHSSHPHPHSHSSHSHADDLNLRAARMHVITDALTSVFAIAALVGGKYLGWPWLDPAMGLVGAGVILVWAAGLIRDTADILLDVGADPNLAHAIRDTLEADGDTRVTDMHLWRVGRSNFACIVSLVATVPKPAEEYRRLVRVHSQVQHLTVEVHAYPPAQATP